MYICISMYLYLSCYRSIYIYRTESRSGLLGGVHCLPGSISITLCQMMDPIPLPFILAPFDIRHGTRSSVNVCQWCA